MTSADLATARTFLFVPGDRPDRFDKAVAAGPDVVIIDLEDAVAPPRKGDARDNTTKWLGAGGRAAVRVNATGSPWYDLDVAGLRDQPGLVGIVLPKAEDPAAAAAVHASTGAPVLAQIETARGLLNAPQIARASGVARLALGGLDLQADVESTDPGLLAFARMHLVIASRAARLEGPVDTVTTDITTGDTAASDARMAHLAGMGGKFCIHPRQVPPVTAAFAPAPEDVQWARRILQAQADGVTVLDGAMVDHPVLLRAERIITRARQAEE